MTKEYLLKLLIYFNKIPKNTYAFYTSNNSVVDLTMPVFVFFYVEGIDVKSITLEKRDVLKMKKEYFIEKINRLWKN